MTLEFRGDRDRKAQLWSYDSVYGGGRRWALTSTNHFGVSSTLHCVSASEAIDMAFGYGLEPVDFDSGHPLAETYLMMLQTPGSLLHWDVRVFRTWTFEFRVRNRTVERRASSRIWKTGFRLRPEDAVLYTKARRYRLCFFGIITREFDFSRNQLGLWQEGFGERGVRRNAPIGNGPRSIVVDYLSESRMLFSDVDAAISVFASTDLTPREVDEFADWQQQEEEASEDKHPWVTRHTEFNPFYDGRILTLSFP